MGDEETEREANRRVHEIIDRALDVQEALRFLNPSQRTVDEQSMPDSDFTAAILETEVVVKDTTDGHIFHFPILGNGTVSLHGARIEANPDAKRQASRYMLNAHNAARTALGRSRA